jgi:IclR family transcriptional regulator, acetate operon repressor
MATDVVKTADRTLDLLEVFARIKEPLSLSELARQLDCPVSSCHGLIRTMKGRGYLYLLRHRRRYYPTRRLLEIGAEIAAHDPLVERLVPTLEALRARTEETVIVGHRQDDEIVYLHVLEGPQVIRYAASPGDRKPLHSSALGKAFLGVLDDAALATLLDGLALKRVTASTITEADELLADVQRSRRRGYFVTRGENVPDVSAVARTMVVESETLGLCVAGPSHRMKPKIAAIGQTLADAAAAVSRGDGQLGAEDHEGQA